MSVINPNTLFHFTNKVESLKLIIKNGLRFSYCFEEFSNNVGIAIPMICFCDIPLLRTIEHRRKYGDYMIGVDKNFLRRHLKYVLNPVYYKDAFFLQNFSAESFNAELEIINSALNNFFEKEIRPILNENKGADIDEIFAKNKDLHYKSDCVMFAKNSLLYTLAFSKLYSFIEVNKGKRSEYVNYDEREWRCVPYFKSYEDDYKLKWIPDISKADYSLKKKSLQETLHKEDEAYLTFKPEEICAAINFIVVKYKRQIPNLISWIMKANKLFGTSNISKELKQQLITKITSFEDIENNF